MPGRLVRRYERFLADIQLDSGETIRAHCVNPGRMEGLVVPGARVWVSTSPKADRSLRCTWELIELDGELVGANTGIPNSVVRALLEHRAIPGFDDTVVVKPEQPLGKGHRVDFVLDTASGPHWVEVKNCHLVYPDGTGYFPDSTSERATSHVEALTRRVQKGERATVIFTLQRLGVQRVRPSALHAPLFSKAVWAAAKKGVRFIAVELEPSLEGLRFTKMIPVDVEPYDSAPLIAWSRALDATTGWARKDGNVAGRSVTDGLVAGAPTRTPRRAVKARSRPRTTE